MESEDKVATHVFIIQFIVSYLMQAANTAIYYGMDRERYLDECAKTFDRLNAYYDKNLASWENPKG